MSAHPALKQAAIKALQEDNLDIGAAGSRLLRGHTQSHANLEDFAAQHFQSGGSLYFSSGFLANYALLTALPNRGDIVLFDSLAHASMRDGLKSGNAKSYKFPHNDIDALETMLKKHHDKAKQIWIVIETLYSMDGDLAPFANIMALANEYNAYVIADEAHSTGIYGEHGKGIVYEYLRLLSLQKKQSVTWPENLIALHTCGKAIGIAGGLVCASKEIIDYLINTARPFIYTTAPMPIQALLVQKSLEILASEDGEKRRENLRNLCTKGQKLFGGSGTHIIPVILGRDEDAINAAQILQDNGYDIRAIRPPTVPEKTARLRISLSSCINPKTLDDIAKILDPSGK